MLRITFSESAKFLGREIHWIYNTLPKIKSKARIFLGAKEIAELIEFSFLASSYENYSYEKIVNKKFVRLVKENTVRDLGRYIKKPADFYDAIIALKTIKKASGMFNIISYISRKLGLEDWRAAFKEYVFSKMAQLFINKKEDLGIVKFAGKSPFDSGIEEEVKRELWRYFRDNYSN